MILISAVLLLSQLAHAGVVMDEIDGFPVPTIDYKYGAVAKETSVDPVTEQDLQQEMFAATEDYRR